MFIASTINTSRVYRRTKKFCDTTYEDRFGINVSTGFTPPPPPPPPPPPTHTHTHTHTDSRNLMRRTYWCGVPNFLMWRTKIWYATSKGCHVSWCGIRKDCVSWYGVVLVFPDVAYNILYILMWRIYCSWHLLIWRTSCISWCGVLFVFPDVACNTLYLLMWRMNYS